MLTFACGALLGAAVAVLFAPKRGRDLRHQLADGTRRASNAVGEAMTRGRRALEAGRAAYNGRAVHDGLPIGAMPVADSRVEPRREDARAVR